MRFYFGCYSLLAIMSVTVHAASVSYSSPFGPLAVPTSPTNVASLPLFDPAFGTLNSVVLQLTANTSAGTISWDNESDVITDVSMGVGANVTATGLAGLAVTSVPLQIGSAIGIASDIDGAPDYVGADSFSVIGGTGTDVDATTLFSGFGAYVGVGTFNVSVDSVVSTFLSTSGGFGPLTVNPGVTDGVVKVTYNFTPIPEASSWILLTAAGLVLGVFTCSQNLRR